MLGCAVMAVKMVALQRPQATALNHLQLAAEGAIAFPAAAKATEPWYAKSHVMKFRVEP